jgi:hypothetical protein
MRVGAPMDLAIDGILHPARLLPRSVEIARHIDLWMDQGDSLPLFFFGANGTSLFVQCILFEDTDHWVWSNRHRDYKFMSMFAK